MNHCTIRIERLQNGYNLRITDPEIVKSNRRADNKDGTTPATRWRDPEVTYAFSTSEDVLEFLQKNIDKALPMDEYSASFDKAAKEINDD